MTYKRTAPALSALTALTASVCTLGLIFPSMAFADDPPPPPDPVVDEGEPAPVLAPAPADQGPVIAQASGMDLARTLTQQVSIPPILTNQCFTSQIMSTVANGFSGIVPQDSALRLADPQQDMANRCVQAAAAQATERQPSGPAEAVPAQGEQPGTQGAVPAAGNPAGAEAASSLVGG